MATYSYSIEDDFHGVMPCPGILRTDIMSAINTVAIIDVYLAGDTVRLAFESPLNDAELLLLTSAIGRAKYCISLYGTYDTADVTASLWQGLVKVGPLPYPLLSVNSSAQINVDTFLTCFGVTNKETSGQVVVGRAGTLCNFTTVVNTASAGTRTLSVRVNGNDVLGVVYPDLELGLKADPGVFQVVQGDLVSIYHMVAGVVNPSVVMATVSVR